MNEELDCNEQKWIEVMERALRKGETERWGGRKGEKARSSLPGEDKQAQMAKRGPI